MHLSRQYPFKMVKENLLKEDCTVLRTFNKENYFTITHPVRLSL
jgi:hypothetical protein